MIAACVHEDVGPGGGQLQRDSPSDSTGGTSNNACLTGQCVRTFHVIVVLVGNLRRKLAIDTTRDRTGFQTVYFRKATTGQVACLPCYQVWKRPLLRRKHGGYRGMARLLA